MIVAFIWPNCNFQKGKWGAKPVDAYFVGLTVDEVKQHFPDMEINQDHLSPAHMTKCGNRLWWLVGKDGSFCDRHAWYYPICNQWNGSSPFVHIQEKEINNFEELKDFS